MAGDVRQEAQVTVPATNSAPAALKRAEAHPSALGMHAAAPASHLARFSACRSSSSSSAYHSPAAGPGWASAAGHTSEQPVAQQARPTRLTKGLGRLDSNSARTCRGSTAAPVSPTCKTPQHLHEVAMQCSASPEARPQVPARLARYLLRLVVRVMIVV